MQEATDVELDERNAFPSNAFNSIIGELYVKWPKMSAGEGVMHSVVLEPKTNGTFKERFC